ncbi:MAG: biopolymer transporter ExbD [Gammaproteobacteria bacterium]|nr:biopolymer transporter ExbD [Gammaproteobacteria bacterium]
MKHLRGHRHRHKEAAELNITAFMNLMVILVPFLLITAVFSRLAVLELNLPNAQSEATNEPPEPELQLEITVREASIEVGDRNGGTLSRIDNGGDGYDLPALSTYLQRVKREFPDKADATLLLEPDISYEVLVEVMDTVRVAELVDEASSEVVRYELFPEISIGDAPIPN